MLRTIQIKIVLIFLVLGIVIIETMGYINYINIQTITEQTVTNVEEYKMMLQTYQEQVKNITIYTIFVFAMVSLLVGVFVTQKVIAPISRLINNAKKITSGEEIET